MVDKLESLVGGNFQLGLEHFLEDCHLNVMDGKFPPAPGKLMNPPSDYPEKCLHKQVQPVT